MKEFEEDLVSLISKITFRDVNDPFLKNVEEDLMKVNSSKDIFVFADKTPNINETSPENYKKLMRENITKSFKISDNKVTDNINQELRDISHYHSISNRIDIMSKPNSLVTPAKMKCRLINAAKKVILEN